MSSVRDYGFDVGIDTEEDKVDAMKMNVASLNAPSSYDEARDLYYRRKKRTVFEYYIKIQEFQRKQRFKRMIMLMKENARAQEAQEAQKMIMPPPADPNVTYTQTSSVRPAYTQKSHIEDQTQDNFYSYIFDMETLARINDPPEYTLEEFAHNAAFNRIEQVQNRDIPNATPGLQNRGRTSAAEMQIGNIRDVSPPIHLLPSNLFSESPPPPLRNEMEVRECKSPEIYNSSDSSALTYEDLCQSIEPVDTSALKQACEIYNLATSINIFTKKYRSIDQAAVEPIQEVNAVVEQEDKSPDEIHNDELPFKLLNELFESTESNGHNIGDYQIQENQYNTPLSLSLNLDTNQYTTRGYQMNQNVPIELVSPILNSERNFTTTSLLQEIPRSQYTSIRSNATAIQLNNLDQESLQQIPSNSFTLPLHVTSIELNQESQQQFSLIPITSTPLSTLGSDFTSMQLDQGSQQAFSSSSSTSQQFKCPRSNVPLIQLDQESQPGIPLTPLTSTQLLSPRPSLTSIQSDRGSQQSFPSIPFTSAQFTNPRTNVTMELGRESQQQFSSIPVTPSQFTGLSYSSNVTSMDLKYHQLSNHNTQVNQESPEQFSSITLTSPQFTNERLNVSSMQPEQELQHLSLIPLALSELSSWPSNLTSIQQDQGYQRPFSSSFFTQFTNDRSNVSSTPLDQESQQQLSLTPLTLSDLSSPPPNLTSIQQDRGTQQPFCVTPYTSAQFTSPISNVSSTHLDQESQQYLSLTPSTLSDLSSPPPNLTSIQQDQGYRRPFSSSLFTQFTNDRSNFSSMHLDQQSQQQLSLTPLTLSDLSSPPPNLTSIQQDRGTQQPFCTTPYTSAQFSSPISNVSSMHLDQESQQQLSLIPLALAELSRPPPNPTFIQQNRETQEPFCLAPFTQFTNDRSNVFSTQLNRDSQHLSLIPLTLSEISSPSPNLTTTQQDQETQQPFCPPPFTSVQFTHPRSNVSVKQRDQGSNQQSLTSYTSTQFVSPGSNVTSTQFDQAAHHQVSPSSFTPMQLLPYELFCSQYNVGADTDERIQYEELDMHESLSPYYYSCDINNADKNNCHTEVPFNINPDEKVIGSNADNMASESKQNCSVFPYFTLGDMEASGEAEIIVDPAKHISGQGRQVGDKLLDIRTEITKIQEDSPDLPDLRAVVSVSDLETPTTNKIEETEISNQFHNELYLDNPEYKQQKIQNEQFYEFQNLFISDINKVTIDKNQLPSTVTYQPISEPIKASWKELKLTSLDQYKTVHEPIVSRHHKFTLMESNSENFSETNVISNHFEDRKRLANHQSENPEYKYVNIVSKDDIIKTSPTEKAKNPNEAVTRMRISNKANNNVVKNTTTGCDGTKSATNTEDEVAKALIKGKNEVATVSAKDKVTNISTRTKDEVPKTKDHQAKVPIKAENEVRNVSIKAKDDCTKAHVKDKITKVSSKTKEEVTNNSTRSKDEVRTTTTKIKDKVTIDPTKSKDKVTKVSTKSKDGVKKASAKTKEEVAKNSTKDKDEVTTKRRIKSKLEKNNKGRKTRRK